MEEQKQQQLEIDLSREVAQGTYANLAIIAHSTSEFIVDFVRLMPGVQKPEVKSRIILTPENTKRLMLALQDNIRKFEQDNGTIRLAGNEQVVFPIGLEPKGQA
jgi:hypothetical protein